eukprot:Colp12_sorted_trinity150504_noHs@25178
MVNTRRKKFTDEDDDVVNLPEPVVEQPKAPEPTAEESDDDAPPEAISLSASKKKALIEKEKQKIVALEAELEVKKKRKAKDEQLKTQKKAKLEKLSLAVLQAAAAEEEQEEEEKREEEIAIAVAAKVQGGIHIKPVQEKGPVKVALLDHVAETSRQIAPDVKSFMSAHFYGDRLKRVAASNVKAKTGRPAKNFVRAK